MTESSSTVAKTPGWLGSRKVDLLFKGTKALAPRRGLLDATSLVGKAFREGCGGVGLTLAVPISSRVRNGSSTNGHAVASGDSKWMA